MARAAEVLEPSVVVIENAPSVRHDRQQIVTVTVDALQAAGYRVAESVVALDRLGVPQARRRHLLLAIRTDLHGDPAEYLQSLSDRDLPRRDVAWAIRDLLDVPEHERTALDVPSSTSAENRRRIAYLMHHDLYELPDSERPPCHRAGGHTYRSVYGRLRWDAPAATITSGFGSMGQGRYVHPELARTLTPHEAARLQFFPDWFDFTANGTVTRRTSWAAMIGNAVPPKLMMELVSLLMPLLADG